MLKINLLITEQLYRLIPRIHLTRTVNFNPILNKKDKPLNRNPPFWLTALIILFSLPLILPFLYAVVRAVDVG